MYVMHTASVRVWNIKNTKISINMLSVHTWALSCRDKYKVDHENVYRHISFQQYLVWLCNFAASSYVLSWWLDELYELFEVISVFSRIIQYLFQCSYNLRGQTFIRVKTYFLNVHIERLSLERSLTTLKTQCPMKTATAPILGDQTCKHWLG